MSPKPPENPKGISQTDRLVSEPGGQSGQPDHDRSTASLKLPAEIPAAKMPKVVSFSTLAACGEEIWIENNGQLYRLRRTSQGKLILTK